MLEWPLGLDDDDLDDEPWLVAGLAGAEGLRDDDGREECPVLALGEECPPVEWLELEWWLPDEGE